MEEDRERVQKRTDEEMDGYNMDDSKAKRHPRGLSSPQRGNILRLMINPNQQNPYMKRIP